MTFDEDERITQPVTVYTGPRWLADAKVRFGAWLEERTRDDTEGKDSITQPVYVARGPRWLADLKIRFGTWLEDWRDDTCQ